MALAVLEVLLREIAVLVEGLAAAERDRLPCVGAQRKAHEACEILPEIEHRLAVRRGEKLPFKMLVLADRDAVRAGEVRRAVVADLHAVPVGDLLAPSIIHLALLHVVFAQRAGLAGLPAAVRAEDGPAVGLQLQPERDVLAVDVAVAVHAGAAAVPAVAEEGDQLILPLAQEAGDVVRLDVQDLVIAAAARREDKIARAAAVEPDFIQAVRRGIEPQRPGGLFRGDGKAFFQIARGLMRFGIALELRVDPPGLIVALLQKTHLVGCALAPIAGLIVLIPEPDLPGDALTALCVLLGKGEHLVRLDPAALPKELPAAEGYDLISRLLFPFHASP